MFIHEYESDANKYREDRYAEFLTWPEYKKREMYQGFIRQFSNLNWSGWVEAIHGDPDEVFQRINYPLPYDDEYYPMWSTMFVANDTELSEWLREHERYLSYLGLFLFYITAEESHAIGMNGAGFSFIDEYWSKLAMAYYYEWYEDDFDPDHDYMALDADEEEE